MNPDLAQLIFGFQSFEEIPLYVKAVCIRIFIMHPRMWYDNKKIKIKHASLNDFDQIIVAKMFMQSFTHRTKFGAIINLSRYTISRAINKWLPLWATSGLYLSLLPVPHDYYKKESPNDDMRENLSNITRLFDGKDTITETFRKDDSLRRRTRSSKVHESVCRTITFATPWDFRLSTLEL